MREVKLPAARQDETYRSVLRVKEQSSSLNRSRFQFTELFPQQPQHQRDNSADEQTGHDGEVKTEIALRVMNVSGQSAEPALADAGPKQRANDHQRDAEHDEPFP